MGDGNSGIDIWAGNRGAAAGGAEVFNKYIDNDIQLQKATALADLQRTTAGKIREDDDAFKEARVGRDRSNRVADIAATGDATNAVALRGKKAEASDTELTQAQVDRENAILKGTTQTKVDARNAELNGTMGAEVKRAGLMARASDLNGGERAARTALLGMELKDKQRLGTLYDQYTAITTDPNMPEADKAAKLKPVSNAIQALKAKNGQVAARDPELDTEVVKQIRHNPDGTDTETVRKQVRRPGAIGSGDSPYDDGTELKGKDGKTYVVTNGKPVLKGGGSLMDAAVKRPAAEKPGAPSAPDIPEGAALDSALVSADEARAALTRYGSRQRQQDPDGFARAQAALQAAQAAEERARTAYDTALSRRGTSLGPSIRYPTP